MSGSKKIKTAIIGIGRWGRNLLREFNEQSNVIWACHRGSPESLKTLESYPHIKSTVNLDDVFRDQSVQAVAIATPTETHFELTMPALRAGKHVFLEKPGTDSYEKLEKLCLEADNRNLRLAVGYVFVHHPAAKKLKELLGEDGVSDAIFEWHKMGTFGNDIITNLVSHDLALVEFWEVFKNSRSPKISVDKMARDISGFLNIIRLKLESTETVDISVNRISPDKRKALTLLSDRAEYVWLNDNLFEVDLTDLKNPLREINLPKVSALGEEVRDFLLAVEHERDPLANGRFGLDVWKMINKIRKSD